MTQEAFAMVNGQLKPNHINHESVLKAMTHIRREMFVREADKMCAYREAIMPLSAERYLLPPLVIAQMIQALDIQPDDVALELASATGYSACVLSRLAQKVYAVESFPDLLGIAQRGLASHDVTNVELIAERLLDGAERESAYDIILIPAAVAVVPKRLLGLLRSQGRLVTLVKKHLDLASIVLFKKSNQKITLTKICETNAPVIHEFRQKQQFLFS